MHRELNSECFRGTLSSTGGGIGGRSRGNLGPKAVEIATNQGQILHKNGVWMQEIATHVHLRWAQTAKWWGVRSYIQYLPFKGEA